jgi:hypothetical protein
MILLDDNTNNLTFRFFLWDLKIDNMYGLE